MSEPQTPLSAERKQSRRPASSYVGSRNRINYNATQPIGGLNVNGESKMISVRDLFQAKEDSKRNRNMNATTVKDDNSYCQKSIRPDSGLQSAYITPKHLYGYFNDRESLQWSNPKFCSSKE